MISNNPLPALGSNEEVAGLHTAGGIVPTMPTTEFCQAQAISSERVTNDGAGMVSEENSEQAASDRPHETPAPTRRFTEEDLKKGAERARILKAALTKTNDGKTLFDLYSLGDLAALLGTSAPTLCRLRKKFCHLSDDQLTPERLAGDFSNSGRNSKWEDFAKGAKVRERLQELYLLSIGASSEYMSKGRRTGSAAATLKVFALDPLCPPELANELRRGAQPRPLVNAIREITDLIEQRHRGPKHASLNGTLTMRRTLIEILQGGQEVKIQPGDWWVFDDMSDNLPHWWTGPENTPFVGRQGLYAYDLTRRWLGVEKIGTVRDSYTAAIILRFLRQLMEVFGKPRRGVVFERSIWQANVIAGCRITTSGDLVEEQIERPGLSAENKALIQDGLEALGIIVYYTYTPRGKEIEGAFNYLQRLKPMLAGKEALNVGRHAGEFEHGAKQLRRVRAGSHHPEDLGFLHMDASRDLDLKTMDLINGDAEPYPTLAPLSDRDCAVFLPQKHELEIRNGKVTATINGQPFDFVAPELFASLGTGYRVAIKFDSSEPTLGAAVYNLVSSSANFRGWQIGEFIGWAEYQREIARFDWRPEKDDSGADQKRRFNGHVRTAFGAVGMKHTRAGTARDGRGNVARVDDGKREPVTAPAIQRTHSIASSAMEDPELRQILEE